MKYSKKLTVKRLRELARKHLGRGRSKLKTKAALLIALKKWLPFGAQPRRKKARQRTASSTRPAEVVTFAPADAAQPARRSKALPTPRLTAPIVEGFFVARLAGEEEARRHHLTEEAAWPEPRDRARGRPLGAARDGPLGRG